RRHTISKRDWSSDVCSSDLDDTYHLPYLFINKSADYPKAMGFELSLKTLSDDTYQYQLYVTEPAKRVTVDLYDPDTLIYQRHFRSEERRVGKECRYGGIV